MQPVQQLGEKGVFYKSGEPFWASYVSPNVKGQNTIKVVFLTKMELYI